MTRLATEDDLEQIRQIIKQCTNELGYVRWPALREAILRHELIVVSDGGLVLGFCHFRRTAGKGMVTVCEIAVRDGYRRMGVGRDLLGYFTQRIKLKVTSDNVQAMEFYHKMGFVMVGMEEGNKRSLYVWERA